MCCCMRSRKALTSAGCSAVGRCAASESCSMRQEPARDALSFACPCSLTPCGCRLLAGRAQFTGSAHHFLARHTHPELLDLAEGGALWLLQVQAGVRAPQLRQVHPPNICLQLVQCPAAERAMEGHSSPEEGPELELQYSDVQQLMGGAAQQSEQAST
jgi:hypothetical protein